MAQIDNSASDFFTQATNFVSAVSGQVDPRTLQFGINIKLGHLQVNNGLSPDLPLTLGYAPMNKSNIGFGIGVSFNISQYLWDTPGNKANGRLIMASGEHYRVNSREVKGQSLQSFKFEISDSSATLYHKDGSLEVFVHKGQVSVPSKIISSSGYEMTLEWSSNGLKLQKIKDNSGELLSIDYTDSDQAVLSILPAATDKQRPFEGYDVELNFDQNHYLKTVITKVLGAAEADWLTWKISYLTTNSWGQWAKQIDHPGGYSESVGYTQGANALFFPPDAKMPNLPYVNTLTISGKNQPLLSKTYKLPTTSPEHNFLGYRSDVTWASTQRADFDPLPSKYTYSSEETYTTTEAAITVTRTYNNYHLLLSVQNRSKSTVADVNTEIGDETVILQETSYKIDKNFSMSMQPDKWFQCPYIQTTTWTDSNKKSRYETTVTISDDWGNPTEQSVTSSSNGVTTDMGSHTVWTYYDVQNTPPDTDKGTGCPADPQNYFKKYIKTKVVTPKGGDTGTPPSPVQISVYAYEALPTPNGVQSVMPSITKVKSQWTYLQQDYHATNELPLATGLRSKVAYTYADKNDTTNGFARLITTASTHYPSGDRKKSYVTTQTDSYVLYAGTQDGLPLNSIIKTSCLYMHDQEQTTSLPEQTLKQEQSCFAARILSETNGLGVKKVAVYDKLGRIISATTAAGSPYANTRKCTYEIDSTGKAAAPFIITATDALGNKARTGLNSSSKLVWGEAQLKGAAAESWQRLQDRTYDNLSRSYTTTNQDYAGLTDEEAITSTGLTTQTASYDNWGQNHQVLDSVSNGILHRKLTDPIGMTVTEYSTSQDGKTQSSRTVTTYNVNRQPIQIDLYPAGGTTKYSTVYQSYDSRNQLCSHTDELGRVTTYDYDDFGRVTTTTLPALNPNDLGSQVVRRYDPQSSSPWLVEISVVDAPANIGGARPPKVRMGTQTFDSLGRVTNRSSGGRTWKASYDSTAGSLTSPSLVTSPGTDGLPTTSNGIIYRYIPELGDKVSSISSVSVAPTTSSKVFTYEPLTGALCTATTTQQTITSTVTHTYMSTGRLETETFTPQTTTPTHYTCTVAGRISSYTDVAGVTQTVTRDIYGRPTAVKDSQVSVTLSYDPLGRQHQWVTTDNATCASVTTQIEWDLLGRETTRTMTSSQNDHSWTLTQDWYANHQLKTKTLNRNNSQVREETYTYDQRNRLKDYVIKGHDNERPQDEKGNRITDQSFTYDVYSNIIRVDSHFADGKMDTMKCSYGDKITLGDKQGSDPCQLFNVSHTHISYTSATPRPANATYDPNGALTDDGWGRTFSYSSYTQKGYLNYASVKGKDVAGKYMNQQATYQYDALNRLITQSSRDNVSETTDSAQFCYRGATLANQLNGTGDEGVRLLTGPAGNLAQVRTGATTPSTWLSGIDANGSVLSVENGSTQVRLAYGPHGEQS